MRLDALLARAVSELKTAGIADPQIEAEILLAHALGFSRTELISRNDLDLAPQQLSAFVPLLERRLKHEPTAYIVGYQPFMGLDFYVDRNVLIPRPETELLVEAVLRATNHEPQSIPRLRSGQANHDPQLTIADLGTGSGCIAIALAKQLPGAKIIACDSSAEALAVARRNARRYQLEGWIDFRQGDMFEPLPEPVEIIVSNPPYIPSAEIDRLQPEVKDWEPRGALDGGKDGLDYIRKLLNKAPNHLIFEFGFGQAGLIKELAKKSYPRFEISKDYSGLERIFSGVRTEKSAVHH
ncbi:MAG: peptide chain release factor N(5)-glutamine methyltransferase [Candidatus Margulisiibacteriota bacterium]